MKPGLEEIWRDRFAARGTRFEDDAGIAGWSRSGLDARMRRFRALWPREQAGGLWLDVGCGAGTYTRHLDAHGCEVLGVDYSLPSLQRARGRAPATIEWFAADVRRLPVQRGAVDGVLCFGVMQALTDPDGPLAELVACVRPGGVIWLDGLNRWFLPTLARELLRRFRHRPRHLRYDSPRRLQRRLMAAGVDDVRLHWLPLAPPGTPRIQSLLESSPARALFRWVPLVGPLFSHSFLLTGRVNAPSAGGR